MWTKRLCSRRPTVSTTQNYDCSAWLLWELVVQVCRSDSSCRRALGAASAIEGLLELGTVQWWAHDGAAQHLVSVVVHADTTRQALGPRAICRHLHIVGPAEWAACARLLGTNELE